MHLVQMHTNLTQFITVQSSTKYFDDYTNWKYPNQCLNVLFLAMFFSLEQWFYIYLPGMSVT